VKSLWTGHLIMPSYLQKHREETWRLVQDGFKINYSPAPIFSITIYFRTSPKMSQCYYTRDWTGQV